MRIQPWKSLVEPRPDVGSTSPEYGVKRGMQLSHSGVRTCGHRSLLVVAREIISALSIVGPASFNTMLSGVEPVPPSGGQLEHRRMRRVAGGRLTDSQAVGIPPAICGLPTVVRVLTSRWGEFPPDGDTGGCIDASRAQHAGRLVTEDV